MDLVSVSWKRSLLQGTYTKETKHFLTSEIELELDRKDYFCSS